MAIYVRGDNRSEAWSREFKGVLNEELDAIRGREHKLGDAIARAHEARLLGLAFSGGGIRSATFNLGVLQALARLRLLRNIDYLSTVSGGGYIGSWLMGWLRRRGLRDVETGLLSDWKEQPGKEEAPEIRFLRRYSNYLTPKLGWFGADMWTVIVIYARNLILNLIVLVAVLSALLLLPRGIGWSAFEFANLPKPLWGIDGFWIWPAALLLLSGICIAVNLHALRTSKSRRPTGALEASDQDVVELLKFPKRWVWVHENCVQPLARLADFAQAAGKLFYREELSDFVLRVNFTPRRDGAMPDLYLHVRPAEPDSTASRSSLGGILERAQCWWLRLKTRIRLFDPAEPVFTKLAAAAAADDCLKCDWPADESIRTGEPSVLEITCAEGAYTFRLNGRTMDACRRPTAAPGWLGVEASDQLQLDEVLLRKLSKPVWLTNQTAIQLVGVLPVVIAALMTAAVFWKHPIAVLADWTWLKILMSPPPLWLFFAAVGAIFGAGIVAASFTARLGGQMIRWAGREFLTRDMVRPPLWTRIRATNIPDLLSRLRRQAVDETWIFITMSLASIVGGFCVAGVYHALHAQSLWLAITIGPPLLIGSMLLGNVLHLGFMGRGYRDEVREWWSRFGAWLLIASIAWVAVFGIALYMPPVMRWARALLAALGIGWIVSTVGGLLAAKSSATGKAHASAWKEIVASIAPYIFIVGMFAMLSWGIDAALLRYAGYPPTRYKIETKPGEKRPSIDLKVLGMQIDDHHWNLLDRASQRHVWTFIGAAALLATLLSWRIDINQFSMHMLYRNRLARCYLGASNKGPREPQRFTGFDPNDDFDLSELSELFRGKTPGGPYPILNAALNLVGGTELAWQQRKAASFVFTPKFCGYDFPELPPGFVETAKFARSKYEPTLATAMAISGAAASPNAGYHTSPAPAFLMTVFNVRLGWWIGNPRVKKGYEKSSPLVLLLHLLLELFGMTDAKRRYIYLSDGGHFENLGIYELVRRRCRFIVACDAEEDHTFGFGGLGNAIEKCRADLGIDIEIDVEPIRRRNELEHSRWHCAIGKIHYAAADGGSHEGTLVYIKSSLTGDEPTDVLRYADANPEFPHQSTADQWFDESQFESYRALGCHAATAVFAAAVSSQEAGEEIKREELFVDLRQRWYPPSGAGVTVTKHSRALVAIYDQLRDNPRLSFLSAQLYPEWQELQDSVAKRGSTLLQLLFRWGEDPRETARGRWLPEDPEDLRAGFYLCNSMIQLMEDVYIDLNLDQEREHPDNRGWINQFKHWSWSGMFRVTWTIVASTYGARFQTFCERWLELTLGTVRAVESASTLSQILGGTETAKTGLNAVERELIALFFQVPENAPLLATSSIHLLQLSPGRDKDHDRAPTFTFGFALLAEPASNTHPQRLIYFRVQDHLRKMGLARKGLRALLEGRHIELSLCRMHASAHEVPNEEERARFEKLFKSVACQMTRVRSRGSGRAGLWVLS